MQDINLRSELEKAQLEFEQHLFVSAVKKILAAESGTEHTIAGRIKTRGDAGSGALPAISQLDAGEIFDIESIESICTRFRLRFLESSFFRGEIPAEAIRKIKHLESTRGIHFERFRLIAPEERFQLIDSTKDPMLFAELPDGRYYFIFQWGDDLRWYQRILKYPFRHMGTLAVTSSTLGLLAALLVPSQFESMQAEFFYRFFMFSMSSCLVMTLAIIAGIMYSKDFSENVWNSRFMR